MCQCGNVTINGVCPSGQVLVTYTLAGTSDTYQECRDPMTVVNNAFVFKLCWAYSCLPPPFAVNPDGFQITAARVPVPNNAVPLTGSTVLASYIEPACATMTSTIVPTDVNIRSIDLDGNSAVVLPETAISGVTFELTVRANCTNKFAAGIIAITEAQAAQPIIPKASCPCWDIPQEGGNCTGIQVPVTLSTVDTQMGVSYRQCVDPANFDVYTGRMAWSFCWRYKCLPDAFASSDFTAEVKEIDRYNIKRMPGSATFNATIQRTPGVLMNVTGKAKVAGEANMFFDVASLVTLPNGDWVSGNITLPPGGINNLTVQYYVPVGFDDLSAAVVMDAWPGPPPPNSPPAPPGTVCRCPSVPDNNNQCPVETVLARTYITDNPSVYTYQCIPLPQYDVFTRFFAFSTCWRWACLPSVFTRKPYTLQINNITQYNIDAMPGGVSRVQWLKPTAVNMTIAAHPLDAPDNVVGPFLSLNGNSDITLPSAGMYSFDVTVSVPAWPWIDGNSGAIIISPGPSPPSPPRPPPRPPLPPAPPVAANTTVVVAEFYVLRQIVNETELNDIIARTSADVSARLAGYLVTLPVAFSDYNAVADCEPSSRQDFITQMARSLGLSTTSLVVSCRYGSTLDSARRRMLQQTSACDSKAIELSVKLSLGAAAGSSIDNVVSSASKSVTDTYGAGSTCLGSSSVATQIQVSQPVTSTSTKATAAVCSSLKSSILLGSAEATSASCSVQTSGISTGTAPASDGGSSAGQAASSSSKGLVPGVVAAIVVGSVVGVAALALIAVKVAKHKREKSFLAPPAAGGDATVVNTNVSYVEETRNAAAAAAARRGMVPGGVPVAQRMGPSRAPAPVQTADVGASGFSPDSVDLPIWDRTSPLKQSSPLSGPQVVTANALRATRPSASGEAPGSRRNTTDGMGATLSIPARSGGPLASLVAAEQAEGRMTRSSSGAWDGEAGAEPARRGSGGGNRISPEGSRPSSAQRGNRISPTISPSSSRPASAGGVRPEAHAVAQRSRLAETTNNPENAPGVEDDEEDMEAMARRMMTGKQ